MLDDQLTTIVTGLALGQNLSATVVLPYSPGKEGGPKERYSLLGDFYELTAVKNHQPVMTMDDFVSSDDGQKLRENGKKNTICFPKGGQEDYERDLKVIGDLCEHTVKLPLPHEDIEDSDQYCDEFPGTVHVSKDGLRRFIFLERLHFHHLCVERFLPWWYDVRMHIVPRAPYITLVRQYLSKLTRPVTVVHLRDLMDGQREREKEEIEKYARQIVELMRGERRAYGTMYLSYRVDGVNVGRVASLFDSEFDNVQRCTDMYGCGSAVPQDLYSPPLNETTFATLFETRFTPGMLETTLSMESDFFIGNIHSSYSRNIGFHRKLHGKPYAVVQGFGEVRKSWSWNLR
eukprot:Plantae.Rhodophyta-Hildenbrandia_rubra.ctg20318.p1 GENE.Plantae.Rhodophyta-Hildenbrandia_rubra.ctg20318~~Plantae.Rhodophyta-Hildenbrandia_rubra.ctg20318.p1  ORF type:complete len:346 (+),score=61.59 Plantae.Rhodophyta-Hildenbrandia_rubra.ctg20318:523-1560(+)